MKKNIKLSVIIPCYNEKSTIKKIVNKVFLLKINKEIIVVDGGSKDGTIDILNNELKSKIDICKIMKCKGKGDAIREGIKLATGDIIIFQDADLEYEPNEYFKIIEPIINNKADVVYGSRFLNKGNRKGYVQNYLSNKFLTWFSNIFTRLKLTDMETCYKAFRSDIIKNIDILESCFGLEPEITAKVAKKKVRIKEVPISYNPRSIAEGKKIKLKDGLRAIYCVIKY